jgi:uncharacterized protein YebE (UPF0316 family)
MAEFDFISYVLLPALIFLARVADVTVATVKLMFVVNNARKAAAILGFFESLITIVALARIMQDASNLPAYIMYAGGFATGTYVGMWIEEKLAYGNVLVRIISKHIPGELLTYLTENQYRYSMVDANEQEGNSQILFTVCQRSRLSAFLETLEQIAPKALYTIEGVKKVSNEFLPETEKSPKLNLARKLLLLGKRTKAAFYPG